MLNSGRDFFEIIYDIVGIVFTPATIFGAMGGIVKSYRNGYAFRKTISEVVCGAMVARICAQSIYEHVPPDLQPMVIFLCGYGGIEIAMFLYCVAKKALAKRLATAIGISDSELMNDRPSEPKKEKTDILP